MYYIHDIFSLRIVDNIINTGLIGQLNADTYNLLVKLQLKMADSIKSVGNIEHEVYPLNRI